MSNPAHSLTQEKTALARLVEKLRQEQALLSETASEGMTDLIGEKATIVAEMTTLAGQRHQLLASLGYADDESGMQQWMNEQGSDDDKEIWAALFDLAQDAKELNRVNGLLIGKKLSINQSALTILQGKSNAGNFYGPDGQSSIKSVGRRLGVV
ncbi:MULTISPECIES: flagella synthesis protein FlgN [unclassified Herbaspirillum]|uniref:flagella synthesis protein FlgN n=1 Tax=unclassified Herbaspirillum TaxID=2624150 RepID=UPI0011515A4F|nr:MULTISPECIES: flagellar protein FlgN [unclassified Herbaspirillum]MBB5392904.1 flagella synthesis protein FlgN [Herbaspirillum sp. SJZ102]TQK04450.1 flagella synthesis protein FlgN [Herbaspirillum sp. SJZ130]TQK09765.1 flagella synthesis protein FlgN [Herbaspirillum sp. SJZ106]TWC65885.1 flagella synthesis protein FlgN [Herbaspirillum sp. SJZ099]